MAPPSTRRPFALVAILLAGCGMPEISQGTGTSTSAGSGADGGADGGLTGQGCGTESQSGSVLCRATSACPNVVVDGQTFPNCGFRILGGAVDLVCSCNGSLCPVGTFASCTQAAALLENQTEAAVCMQVAEGRCAAGEGTSGTSGSPTCNRECVAECGGGSACASVCGC